ncbi:MAG: hypothetical protein BWK80_33450 [Desulfobacteraceae bacterium IS3]|nr:MAG: hypothetical protein BWK80_33450 [Desulfobacteraceae bacterium IS3]
MEVKIGSILLILVSGILFLAQSICYAVTGQFVFTVKPVITGDPGAAKELHETIAAFSSDEYA